MSTRSTISAKLDDYIYSIYCHWDGYPDHHLPILTEHYNTEEAIEKLMALGDLSSLEVSTECPEGHTFDTPIKGYCIAYGRDRGDDGTEAIKTSHWLNMQKQEYNYFWENGTWSVTKG